jgi:hypothetical protein
MHRSDRFGYGKTVWFANQAQLYDSRSGDAAMAVAEPRFAQ